MPSTAGSVCLRAAIHLNDPNQLVYTTAVLIPYLNMAIDELDEELAVYEVTPMRKKSIVIDVAAGATVLASYPVDYVETIALYDRADGNTGDWFEVKEVIEVDQNYTTASGIEYWASRNGLININPPTSARDVKLEYIAGMTIATQSSTGIDIESSRRFLSLLTARNAARDAGNSISKAGSFKEDIDRARDRVVRRLQKSVQGVAGVRRKPYRGRSS